MKKSYIIFFVIVIAGVLAFVYRDKIASMFNGSAQSTTNNSRVIVDPSHPVTDKDRCLLNGGIWNNSTGTCSQA